MPLTMAIRQAPMVRKTDSIYGSVLVVGEACFDRVHVLTQETTAPILAYFIV
jgi:hypothetical protein